MPHLHWSPQLRSLHVQTSVLPALRETARCRQHLCQHELHPQLKQQIPAPQLLNL